MRPIYLFSTSSHLNAITINSLEIKLLKPDINFSHYDYFLITSKQVSKALKQYDSCALKPALCVSKQSAVKYESIGGSILDIGAGYGESLVDKIKEYTKDTKWLYLRAKVVASDFVLQCKNDGYSIDEIVLYESKCSQEIENTTIEDNSVLIFTSPSSVRCFMKSHQISKKSKVIVIGKTTAAALPKDLKLVVSDDNTIERCIQIALNL